MRAPRAVRIVVAAVVTALVAGLVAHAGGRAAAAGPEPRDVSASLAEIRARHDVPGLVAATIAADGSVVARGVAGVRRRGAADALAFDDPMHLGSCTKAMTATLCAALVADAGGKLRWDDRPSKTFAKTVGKPHAGWAGATLEQLLRNRGGAPESLDADGLWARLCGHAGPPRAARLALVKGVLAAAPACPPGTAYAYSNAGFAIAGAMAEEAADAAFEDLMRRRLFEPLGMTSAGFGPPRGDARRGAPCGHRADGSPVDAGPDADNPDAIAPAGKVHATLADWGRFVALHLRRGKDAPAALAGLDFVRLHTAAASDDGSGPAYAMGWGVGERPWAKGEGDDDRGRVLTHSGSNTMWYCVAWLAPERGFAVLAATNQGGDGAAAACDEAVGALIVDRLSAPR